MSGNNILYFSERCPYSKKLMAKIYNTPLFNIQKVCVDTLEVRQKLPRYVVQTNKIPLIVLQQPHPKYGQLLYENTMWGWIEEQLNIIQTTAIGNFNQPRPSDHPREQPRQMEQPRDQPMHNPTGQRGPPPPEPGNTTNKPSLPNDTDGFLAYNPLEMGGGISSDLYAPFNSQGDQPLYEHSYEKVGNFQQQQPAQYQPSQQPMQPSQSSGSGSGGESRNSQKKDKIEQDFAMLQAMRKNEPYAQDNKPITGIPDNFEQQWNNQRNNTGRPSYVQ